MPPKKTAKKKTKSKVNEAGNYTKPTMRKSLFNKIKAGSKGGKPGQWSARPKWQGRPPCRGATIPGHKCQKRKPS